MSAGSGGASRRQDRGPRFEPCVALDSPSPRTIVPRSIAHPSVRVRLALVATTGAVVALVVLSLSVNALLERNLITDVDARLAERATAVSTEISEQGSIEPPVDTSDPEYREPILVWRYTSTG